MLRPFNLLLMSLWLTGCVTSPEVDRVPSAVQVISINVPEKKYTPPKPAIELLIQDRKFTAAESILRRQLVSKPSDLSARVNLALLYTHNGQTSEGIERLMEITAQHPEVCAAQVRLGQLHRIEFEFDQAEAAYQTCLDHDSEYAPALLNLGILYELYRGEFNQALEMYKRYQQTHHSPDKNVAGWISDLSRRLARLQQLAEVRP